MGVKPLDFYSYTDESLANEMQDFFGFPVVNKDARRTLDYPVHKWEAVIMALRNTKPKNGHAVLSREEIETWRDRMLDGWPEEEDQSEINRLCDMAVRGITATRGTQEE